VIPPVTASEKGEAQREGLSFIKEGQCDATSIVGLSCHIHLPVFMLSGVMLELKTRSSRMLHERERAALFGEWVLPIFVP